MAEIPADNHSSPPSNFKLLHTVVSTEPGAPILGVFLFFILFWISFALDSWRPRWKLFKSYERFIPAAFVLSIFAPLITIKLFILVGVAPAYFGSGIQIVGTFSESCAPGKESASSSNCDFEAFSAWVQDVTSDASNWDISDTAKASSVAEWAIMLSIFTVLMALAIWLARIAKRTDRKRMAQKQEFLERMTEVSGRRRTETETEKILDA